MESHNNGKNENNMPTQWDRIEALMRKHGVSHRGLSLGAGRSHSAYAKWVGKDNLSKDTLARIANFFRDKFAENVTWEYLRDGDTGALPEPLNRDITLGVMRAIAVVCEEDNIRLNDVAYAGLLATLIPLCQHFGEVPMQWIRSQVRMAAWGQSDK